MIEENNLEQNVVKQNFGENVSEQYLDENKVFIFGDGIAEKLDISNKTLFSLAESGEFDLGRIAGKKIINKPQLLAFLDRYHFVGIENENDDIAIDNKGRLKTGLTYIKEKHTDIPILKPIEFFAKELRMDKRNFIRHCDIGTFYHYRIGTSYKMSIEDWEKSLKKITQEKMKSNRGSKNVKKVGRRSVVEKRIHEMKMRQEQEEN